ncbi:MAG: arginase family protein [Clostridia bacterium]
MKYEDDMIHSGIATFTASEYVTIDEAKKYDIAVVGLPVDMGLTYRLGAAEAPRKIRECSMWKKIDGMECYDYDNRKYVKTNDLKICDVGDMNIWHGDMEKTQNAIIDTISKLRKNTFPIILGGDHSITYGSFIGIKKGGNYKKVGLIQFDAHNDTEPDTAFFSRINHSNQFTNLIKEGYLNGSDMLTIGLRGLCNRVWNDFADEHKITIITANEFNKKSSSEVGDFIYEKYKEYDAVYVTFDMDSLEAAYSEGTGTPKYNGINGLKALEVIRSLNKINTVGFDLVELSPSHDTTGITSFMAWEVLYNFLAVGYKKQNLKK